MQNGDPPSGSTANGNSGGHGSDGDDDSPDIDYPPGPTLSTDIEEAHSAAEAAGKTTYKDPATGYTVRIPHSGFSLVLLFFSVLWRKSEVFTAEGAGQKPVRTPITEYAVRNPWCGFSLALFFTSHSLEEC